MILSLENRNIIGEIKGKNDGEISKIRVLKSPNCSSLIRGISCGND